MTSIKIDSFIRKPNFTIIVGVNAKKVSVTRKKNMKGTFVLIKLIEYAENSFFPLHSNIFSVSALEPFLY